MPDANYFYEIYKGISYASMTGLLSIFGACSSVHVPEYGLLTSSSLKKTDVKNLLIYR